jgi:hypothetical protein
MDPSTRVCPFCGEPPGVAMFCASCGRNLAGVERLPTVAERRAAATPTLTVEEAVARFLRAMHAAGDPGAKKIPLRKPASFGRTRHVQGWIVRPVDREDLDGPKRYEPGLLLTVEGSFHQLDSELRGWGQRDFPTYHHTASDEPIDLPADEALADELAAVLSANGLDG